MCRSKNSINAEAMNSPDHQRNRAMTKWKASVKKQPQNKCKPLCNKSYIFPFKMSKYHKFSLSYICLALETFCTACGLWSLWDTLGSRALTDALKSPAKENPTTINRRRGEKNDSRSSIHTEWATEKERNGTKYNHRMSYRTIERKIKVKTRRKANK